METASDFYQNGDIKHATELYEAALREARKLDPRDPRLGDSLFRLGALKYEQGDYKDAEPLLKQAFECFDDTNDPNSISHSAKMKNLVRDLIDVYKQLDKHKEADLLRKRAAVYLYGTGFDAQVSQRARQIERGHELLTEHKYSDAIATLLPAFQACKSTDGLNEKTFEVFDDLQVAYIGAAKYGDCEKLCRDTLDEYESSHGKQPKTVELMLDLANVARKQGRLAEAAVIEKHAVDICDDAPCFVQNSKGVRLLIDGLVAKNKCGQAIVVLKHQLYALKGNVEGDYERTRSFDRMCLVIEKRIGKLSMKVGNFVDAVLYYKMATDIDSKYFSERAAAEKPTYFQQVTSDYRAYIDALEHLGPSQPGLEEARKRLTEISAIEEKHATPGRL
jgi:tetratricopeptide (TPR) repeat protein